MTNGHSAQFPSGPGEPPLVLTVRGRRVLLVLALVLLTLVALGLRAAFADDSKADAGAQTAAASPTSTQSAGAATPSPSPSATPSPPVSPTPRVVSTKGGVPRSGLVGTGKFTTSTVALPAVKKTATLHRFVVKVEGGVAVDPNDAARQVHAVLNDERGWLDYHGASFAAVAEASDADLVIHLASPPTTTKMCAPLKVGGKWSCAAGRKVILNSDRWLLRTKTYDNTDDYRAYLVNHEVGHYLGRGHVGCPKAGNPAPVMLQQSISLEGCKPNAWPRTETSAG